MGKKRPIPKKDVDICTTNIANLSVPRRTLVCVGGKRAKESFSGRDIVGVSDLDIVIDRLGEHDTDVLAVIEGLNVLLVEKEEVKEGLDEIDPV